MEQIKFMMQSFQQLKGIALMSFLRSVVVSFVGLLLADYAFAHVGALNKDGCHIDESNGDYHCHRVPGSPTIPEPNQESESPNRKVVREELDVDSWKNIGNLGYASVGVFGEVGLGLGEMNFQGADQTCFVADVRGLDPQICNLSTRTMDFGAYAESNIALFKEDYTSVFVGVEIGTAAVLGGKFYNCYDGSWYWLLDWDDSDQARYSRDKCSNGYDRRVGAGALNGYSYIDIKFGGTEVLPTSESLFPGNPKGDFIFVYVLTGQVEFSSGWGKYRKPEFGIGSDYHFSPHGSMRIKWTNRRLSFILRAHF